jgi:hypothetical protein
MTEDHKEKKLLEAVLDGDASLDAAADILAAIDDARRLGDALGHNAGDLPLRLLSPGRFRLDGDLLWSLAEMQLRGVGLLANFARKQIAARLDGGDPLGDSERNVVHTTGPIGGKAVGHFVIQNKKKKDVDVEGPKTIRLREAGSNGFHVQPEFNKLTGKLARDEKRRVELVVPLTESQFQVGGTYAGHFWLKADGKDFQSLVVRVSVRRRRDEA